jgi:hypothetical protein
MANSEIPQTSVPGGDLPFTNFGKTPIPADRGVVVDAANDYGVTLPPSNAAVKGAVGVTVERIPPGATGRVRTLGIKRVFADGPITRGDDVALSSAAGKEGFVKTTAGPGAIGKALMTTGDGDALAILMLLARSG